MIRKSLQENTFAQSLPVRTIPPPTPPIFAPPAFSPNPTSHRAHSVKHSVGQKSRSWPHLAAATALAASGALESSPFASPPLTPPAAFNSRKPFADGGGGGGRRSNLRATFPGEPPLESSPAGRGGPGAGGGGEGQGLAPGSHEEGYMSFAALT